MMLNRIFFFLVFLFVMAINGAVVFAVLFVAYVSQAKITWMMAHGMVRHEIAYSGFGILLLVVGAFALRDGWRIAKTVYPLISGEKTRNDKSRV